MMAGHGAVEFVVVGFAGGRIDENLGPALREQVDKGVIRIIDLLFVRKEEDGTPRMLELEEVATEDDFRQFEGVPQQIDGLIAQADVEEFAEEIPAGTTAMLVLFEHTWLRELRQAVEASGGRVVFSERIPGEVVDAVEEVAVAMATNAPAAAAG
jgi:hypothetical protein